MSCPICDKPSIKDYKPFCSERCKMVDLGKWVTGAYAVPAVELDDVNLDELEIPDEPDA